MQKCLLCFGRYARVKFLLICFFSVQLSACSVLDPQRMLSRGFGNEAPVAGATLDSATRREAFDFVWNRVNDAYVDPKFRGLDWQAVGEKNRPIVLNSLDDEVFWKKLDFMVGELGDAHTRVLSSKQYSFFKDKQSKTLGLDLLELGGEIIVKSVTNASPAYKAGLEKGNKIVEISGMLAADWWHMQLQKTRKNSTDRARVSGVKRIFNVGDSEFPSEELIIKVEANDKSVRDVVLVREIMPRVDTLTSSILPSGYGYLRLSGFEAKLSGDVNKTFQKIQNTPGLIIDLRGNGGGSLGLATTMMAQLVKGRVAAGRKITRTGKPPSMLFGLLNAGKLESEIVGVARPYLAPVVVLVDAGSASASELFSGTLQSLGRVSIVGETSCGCLLGYFGYANVPGGGALAYSELDFELPSGKRVEGVGVIPDVMISQTRQDLIQGRDVALDVAIALLTKRSDEKFAESKKDSAATLDGAIKPEFPR